MEKFSNIYKKLLSETKGDLNKLNKPALVEHLTVAFQALEIADKLCKQQSDTILRTTNELLKQCELARGSLEKPSSTNMGQNDIGTRTVKSYANSVKTVPAIIVKKNENSDEISSSEANEKMKKALISVKVNKTIIKRNGTMVVETPNQESFSNAISSLRSEFSNFSVSESKKIAPKLTIINVPIDLNNNDFVKDVCKKDAYIKDCIERKEEFSIINSWDMKDKSGKNSSKKIAIKCSPAIRNYIIDDNKGYIYLSLARCKVYDRFYVPQCFHCQRYNHFSRECPDKEKNSVCAKCSKNHDTKNCPENSTNCINCIRNKEKNTKHTSFSPNCPVLIGLRKKVMAQTDYSSPAKNSIQSKGAQ